MKTPSNDGGSAFPLLDGYHLDGRHRSGEAGMTLRDYFAGQSLISMCASSDKEMDKLKPDGKYFEKHVRDWYEIAGLRAYCYADAMLAARERKEDAK